MRRTRVRTALILQPNGTSDAEDRENVFRYIVGQCLDGLKSVAIHSIMHKFVAGWKKQIHMTRNCPCNSQITRYHP